MGTRCFTKCNSLSPPNVFTKVMYIQEVKQQHHHRPSVKEKKKKKSKYCGGAQIAGGWSFNSIKKVQLYLLPSISPTMRRSSSEAKNIRRELLYNRGTTLLPVLSNLLSKTISAKYNAIKMVTSFLPRCPSAPLTSLPIFHQGNLRFSPSFIEINIQVKRQSRLLCVIYSGFK